MTLACCVIRREPMLPACFFVSMVQLHADAVEEQAGA